MSEIRAQAQELIYLVAMELRAQGADLPEEVKALVNRRRDRNEPGWREKEAAQEEMALTLRSYWRKQKRRISDALGTFFPDRKAVWSISLGQDLGEEFWKTEDEDLKAEIMIQLMQSAMGGADLFSAGTNVGFDIDPAKKASAEWARVHAGELSKIVNKTTRDQLGQALRMFIETPGFTIRDVTSVLDSSVYSEARALTVAVTETTRAYAEGQKLAGDAVREEYPTAHMQKEWFTNNDDLVCDLCGPLNEQIVDEVNMFSTEGNLAVDAPPLHPNCRCWMEVFMGFDE